MKLSEAKYVGNEQGSIEWFLDSFFDQNETYETDHHTFEAQWYIKDEFKAQDPDGDAIRGIFAIFKLATSDPQPDWRKAQPKDISWIQFMDGERQDDVKDPRAEITIVFGKHAWPPAKHKPFLGETFKEFLKEAKYAGNPSKGSFEWIIQNFFVLDSTREYEYDTGPGYYYEVKPGIQITARGAQVIAVHTFPNGDHEFITRHSDHGSEVSRYVDLKDLVVTQVKQLWPQSP